MGRFRTLTRIIIKINNMRGSLTMDPQPTDINQIIIELKMEGNKPSIRLIRALSDALIFESEEQYSSGVTLLYYAIAAREWMFGSNPGMSMKRATVKSDDLLILARGHFELWQRMGLLTAEAYHLQRSKELFEEFFALEDENIAVSPPRSPAMDRSSRLARIEDMVIYCKVLQHCGEMVVAAQVIANVIAQAVDGDPEYPNHLFVAGAVHKAIGELDKANNYFFEASQIGPPRYFSKLEIMIIISRCIEEGGGPIEAMGEDQNEDDPNDAYAMVHAHLVLEGQLDAKIDVEDWISDSNTWLSLGDKCAAHQMYSLATDLYGLGIARDQEAFKKPMLWFRFAKACARCGRVADAQLAIKQALTRAPYHPQLRLADEHFSNSDPQSDFQALVKGEFAVILSSLPANLNQNQVEANATRIFHRLQAVVKGYLHRRDWSRGVGTRTDITSCVRAKVAFMLRDDKISSTTTQEGIDSSHPLLLSTAGSWMGRVSNIVIYDVRCNVTKTFPLPCLLCPLQRSGRPRKLSLQMVIHHDDNDSNNAILILRYEEEEDENEEGEEKIFYQKPFILRLTTTNSNNSLLFDPTTISHRRLGHRQQQQQGKLKQSVIESVKQLGAHLEHHRQDRIEKTKALQILGIWARENRPTMSLYSTRMMQGGAKPDPKVNSVQQMENKSVLHRLVIEESDGSDINKEKKERKHVIHTNIHTAEIARGGFTYNSQSFLYRIRNEGEVTQISLFHCRSNQTVLFLLMREFIDRAVNVVKACMKLLDVIRVHPALGRQLPLSSSGDYANASKDGNDMEMVDLPEVLRQEDGRAVPFYVLRGSSHHNNNASVEEENLNDDNPSATSYTSRENDHSHNNDSNNNSGYCYNVYSQDLPTGQGTTFVIVDAKQQTIIADNFEVSSAAHDPVTYDDNESDAHSYNSQVSQGSSQEGSQKSQSSLRIKRLNDILISPENRSVASQDSSMASVTAFQPPPSMVIVSSDDINYNGEQEQYDTARTALTEDSFIIEEPLLPTIVTNNSAPALSPPNPSLQLSGRRVLFSADSGERSPAVIAENNTPPLSRSSSMKSAMKRQISMTFTSPSSLDSSSPKTLPPPQALLQQAQQQLQHTSSSKFIYLRTAIEQQAMTVRAILDIFEVEIKSMSMLNSLRSDLAHAAEDGSRIANYQQQLTSILNDCQSDIDSIINNFEYKLANNTETAEVKGETDEEKIHKLRLRISTKFQPFKSKSVMLQDSFHKVQVESESLRIKEFTRLINELKVVEEDDDFSSLIEAKKKVLELFTSSKKEANEEKSSLSLILVQEYVHHAESSLLALLSNIQKNIPDNDFELAKALSSTFEGIFVVIGRLFRLTSKSQKEVMKRSEMVEKLIEMSVAGESVAVIHATFNNSAVVNISATNEDEKVEFSGLNFFHHINEQTEANANYSSTKAMEKRGIYLVQITQYFLKLKMMTLHSTYALSAQTYDLFRALEDCNQQSLSLNIYRISQQLLTATIIREEFIKQQDLSNLLLDITIFQEISFALLNNTLPTLNLFKYSKDVKNVLIAEFQVEEIRQILTVTRIACLHFEFEEKRLMKRLLQLFDDDDELQQQLQVEAEKMEQHVVEKSALIHASMEQEVRMQIQNLDTLHEDIVKIFSEYQGNISQVYDSAVSEQQAMLLEPSTTLQKAKRFLEINQQTLLCTLPLYTSFATSYEYYIQSRLANQQLRVIKQAEINDQEYAELELVENRMDEEIQQLSYYYLNTIIEDVLANQLSLSLVNEAIESETAAYHQLQLVKVKLQQEQEHQLQIKQAKLELERQQKDLFLSQISENIFDLVFSEVGVSELLIPLTKSTLNQVTRQERRLRLGLTKLLHEMIERMEMSVEDFNCPDIPYVTRANNLQQRKVLTKVMGIKYHKIHSGIIYNNNKKRDALVPNLDRRMKRQPVASSLAIASDLFASHAYQQQRHPNFNNNSNVGTNNNKSLLQYEYEQSQRAATFAFDSAEELKQALQGDAGASLTTSSSTLESFLIMPNLHKQPSDHHHSRRVSPEKILFSSTLNPAHDHPQRVLLQHAGHHHHHHHHHQSSSAAGSSVARSLSSTSWQSGRFSIEKPIVQATNNHNSDDNNNSVANSSLTSTNSSSHKKKSATHTHNSDNNNKKKEGVALFSEERELIAKYADQEDGLFIQSLKEVQSLGYVPTFQVTGKVGGTVQKRPWAYAAHWQRLLADFLEFHARPVVVKHSSSNKQQQRPPFYNLRKKLKTLQRAMSATGALFPRGHGHAPSHIKQSTLSLEEMICSLAETRDSVGGVLVKLQDSNEFISEIRLVCGSLNVRAMVCALPGGSSFFHQMVQSVASPDDPSLNLSFNDSNSLTLLLSSDEDDNSSMMQSHSPFGGSKDRVVMSRRAPPVIMHVNSKPLDSNANFEELESLAENDIDMSSQTLMMNMSNFSTDSRDNNDSYDRFNSGEVTPPPQQILSRDVSRRMLDRPTSLPTLRDHTNTFLLPHLHLDQQSMVVLRKASMVSFRSSNDVISSVASPAPGSARSSLSIDSSAPSSVPSSLSPNKLPRSVTFAASDRSLLKDSLKRTASSLSPKIPTLAPLSPPGQQLLLSLQQVSSDDDDSFDNNDSHHQHQQSSPSMRRQLSLTTSPIESASGLAHTKKSFRVHEHLVETLFAEHADIPVAILCRRDAIKAQQDQTLLKSDKRYIRAPIENKLTRLASQRSMSSVNLLRSSPSSSSLLASPLSSPMNASGKSEKSQKLMRMKSIFSSTSSSIAEGTGEDL